MEECCSYQEYKDPRFSPEAIRGLFRAVAEAPLGQLLPQLDEYAGLRGAWRRTQLQEVFGRWAASPHWWRQEPCSATRAGIFCSRCRGDPDRLHDAEEYCLRCCCGRQYCDEGDEWYDGPHPVQTMVYAGCNESHTLLATAHGFRTARDAAIIARALDAICHQGRAAVRILHYAGGTRFVRAICGRGSLRSGDRAEAREIVAFSPDSVAEELQEALGIYDDLLGGAEGFPLAIQVLCGRYRACAESRFYIANHFGEALCRTDEIQDRPALRAWCRRHFIAPDLQAALDRVEAEVAAHRALLASARWVWIRLVVRRA